MKPFLAFVFVFQFSALVSAATDSVAFFHSPEKAVVLVKEFSRQGRLQSFMNMFGAAQQLVTHNQDASIRISCARNLSEASCTFGFSPGEFTHFGEKTLEAKQLLQDLNLSTAGDFEMKFENSRQQRFELKVEAGVLSLKAFKRGA